MLIVKDLHFRQKGMKIEIEGLEKVKTKNKNYINSFETEVSECYQTINVKLFVIHFLIFWYRISNFSKKEYLDYLTNTSKMKKRNWRSRWTSRQNSSTKGNILKPT